MTLPRPARRRIRSALATAQVALLAAASAPAHEVITTELTWTRTVSRIVHLRCAGCHRAGGSAPMPLTTYAEVRPWAKAIKHEVLTRRMPPWGAAKGFGSFRNDRSLSLPEIAVLSSWVEGGAPEGRPEDFQPFHAHGGSESEGWPAAERLAVRGRRTLQRDALALGVSAASGSGPDWMQLTAHLPDGRVEHLLWLRPPRPPGAADYWFARAVALPAGTELVCEPAEAAADLRIRGGTP